jgi:predicted naringenin-chalcone synthase
VTAKDITHLITVSCTGLFTPGFEFLVSEHYSLQHSEKLALNFLGCYAAVKALKHAKYIADANPNSCILIVSAELCSLHFLASVIDEDIIANLLFADGAAATIICGNTSKHIENNCVLKIDDIGSSYIPNTLDLMTWNISSSAFRMYLDKNIVSAIKSNIFPIVSDFLAGSKQDYWAIHPGGVRIVDAVKDSLGLTDADIEDSMSVLRNNGNMSSPTILFVLKNILTKIRDAAHIENKNIFCCAFGPGLSIELIRFSSVDAANPKNTTLAKEKYAIEI